MTTIDSAGERILDLRRETNALYGLLDFAGARRYPEQVIEGLRAMLVLRVCELDRLSADRTRPHPA
ncbi:MAG: hypothetical protein AB7Q97_03100 [Gammaproteobacteria bacterium]